MKNIKINKKVTVLLSFLSVIICLLGGMYFNNKNDEKIYAKPAGPLIIVDPNTISPFTIPNDGTKIYEDILANDLTFQDYVQTNKFLTTSEKAIMNATSTKIGDQVYRTVRINDEVVAVLYRQYNHPGNITAPYVVLLENDGTVIVRIPLGTTTANTETNNVNNTAATGIPDDYKLPANYGLIRTSDTSFNYVYGGYTGSTTVSVSWNPSNIKNTILKTRKNISGDLKSDYVHTVVADIYSSDEAHTISGRITGTGIANTVLYAQDISLSNSSYINGSFTYLPYVPPTGATTDYGQTAYKMSDGSLISHTTSYAPGVVGPAFSLYRWSVTPRNSSSKIGKLEETIRTLPDSKSMFTIISGISDENYHYFLLNDFSDGPKGKTKLLRFTAYGYKGNTSYKAEVVKVYENAETSMTLAKIDDPDYPDAMYYVSGYCSEIPSEFVGKLDRPGNFVGTLDEDFQPVVLTTLDTSSGAIQYKDMVYTKGYVTIGANMDVANKDFAIVPPSPLGKYETKLSVASGITPYQNAAYGAYKLIRDYAPVIKVTNDIQVNIDDPLIKDLTVDGNGLTPLDRWLITGKKNGNYTDADAVKVFDTMDLDVTQGGKTQKWLNERLVRNPLTEQIQTINTSKYAAVDWKALGFNNQLAGPQLATYFATDRLEQTTSNSRWVNKTTDRTVIDGDTYFDLHDFTYPLKSRNDLSDNDLVKELSRSMAWFTEEVTTNGKIKKEATIDESYVEKDFSPKVSIDQTELKAVIDAKKAGPYPITFTYVSTNTNGTKVTLTNRATVFLSDYRFDDLNGKHADDDDSENDITRKLAIYADDYTLPLYLAKKETKKKFFDTSDIKVYEFDKQRVTEVDGNGNPTTITLADKDKLAAGDTLEPVLSYQTAFNNANYPGKMDMHVDYEGKNSKGDVVKLRSKFVITLIPEVLLHLRQVVLEPMNELVVPTEGYFNLNNVKVADPEDKADLSYNVITESNIEIPDPSYKEVIVPFEFDYDEPDMAKQFGAIAVTDVMPEYYQYDGFSLTYNKTDINDASTKINSPAFWPIIDSKDHHEAWITVFIKPTVKNTEHPRPYSWDYKLNEFGEVKE